MDPQVVATIGGTAVGVLMAIVPWAVAMHSKLNVIAARLEALSISIDRERTRHAQDHQRIWSVCTLCDRRVQEMPAR